MNQQQESDKERQGVNVVILTGKALAACWWPFCRVNSGREALGIHVLLSILIMIFVACAANTDAGWIFMLCWLLACLKQKAMRKQAYKKGLIPHTRYEGFPWLAQKLFPRIKTEGNLKAAEAFLGIVVGALLTYLEPVLGYLLIMSGIAILINEALNVDARKRRVSQMRDAQLEMHQLTDDFQNHF